MAGFTRFISKTSARALCLSSLTLAMIVPLAGCGGGMRLFGGGVSASATRKIGSFQISVKWPERTRLIPQAAESILVEVLDDNGNVVPGFSKVLVRPTNISGTPEVATVTINDLEVGATLATARVYRIHARAYPTPTPDTTTDVAQAEGMSAPIPLYFDHPSEPVAFTMASTIVNIRITPSTGTVMRIGKTRDLLATAYDAFGSVVITSPSKLTWTTSDAAVASLSATVGASVTATAQGAGTAIVRVKDTESGIESLAVTDYSVIRVANPGLATDAWSKFHGNAQNTGAVGSWALSSVAQGIADWQSFANGAILLTSPALGPVNPENAEFSLFVGSQDGSLYAFSGNTGAPLWSFPTRGAIDSSPAVSQDGIVYVGSDDRKVYAVDAEDGTRVAVSATLDGPVSSSPAIGADGFLYVGTDAPGRRFYKLNPHTLATVWSVQVGVNGIVNCAAFSNDGSVVYFGARDGNAYALQVADGTAVAGWPVNLGTDVFASSPVVDSAGNIYIVNSAGVVHSLTAAGVTRWTRDLGVPIFATPALAADGAGVPTALYVATCDISTGNDTSGVFSLDPATGTVAWRYPDLSVPGTPTITPISSSPAIGKDGTIYVGIWSGDVLALSPTGTLLWSLDTGDIVESSPAIGRDGKLYVGNHSGGIYAIR